MELGKPLAELFKSPFRVVGRSPRPDLGQFLHLLVNRLVRRSFVGSPATEDSRDSIPIGVHRFAQRFNLEYKRVDTACEVAMGYGWLKQKWVGTSDSGTRPYGRMCYPSIELLSNVRDTYLDEVKRSISIATTDIPRWRPQSGRALPFAFTLGLSPEDAALIYATSTLPRAWFALLEVFGIGLAEQHSSLEEGYCLSPQISTDPALIRSELAYGLVLILIRHAALPTRVGSTAISLGKLEKLSAVTQLRLKASADLIVQRGWAERFGGGLRATELLIRDAVEFYLPAVRQIWTDKLGCSH